MTASAAVATLGACLAAARAALPRLEADLLAARALRVPRSTLHAFPERPAPAAGGACLAALVARRRRGEPVAHILGEREFWSLALKVDARALIPRPETEGVVEAALERTGATPAVLDLGTGCGAIALAIAAERPAAKVLGVEWHTPALDLAVENAERLGSGAAFRRSDWYAAVTGEFDLIVANPPYIAAHDPHLAQGDLRFEPKHALVGGVDGLAALKSVIGGAPGRLASGGWLIVEHGHTQGGAVRRLFAAAGFVAVETRQDLAGRPRVTLGRRR